MLHQRSCHHWGPRWGGVPATLKAPASFSPPPENHHTPDPWGQQSSLASQLLFLRREGGGARRGYLSATLYSLWDSVKWGSGVVGQWPPPTPIPHSSSEPERTSDPQLIHNMGKHERKPVPSQFFFWMWMFTVALFIIAPNWKQTKCPWTGE